MTRRVRGLDGIRGLAILLVLVSHFAGLTGAGLVGVLIFFVLSGYLITTLLMNEHDRRGAISLRLFYARRALRLLPALGVLLLLVAALSFVPRAGVTHEEAQRGAAFALFYVTDIVVGLQGPYVPELEHLWTLAVEEQFYLVWPVVLILVVRRVAAPEGRVRALARLFAVGALVRLATLALAPATNLFFYAFPTTWTDSLLAGCLLAVILRDRGSAGVRWLDGGRGRISLAVATAVVLGFAVHPATYWSPLTYVVGLPLLYGAAAILLLAGLGTLHSPLTRVLSSPPLTWLGDHSYGLYLFNSTIVLVTHHVWGAGPVTRTLALVLTLAAAAVCRWGVEQPALRLRRRLRPTAVDAASLTG